MTPTAIYSCAKCYALKSRPDANKKCSECDSYQTTSRQISRLVPSAEYFIDGNIWLEYGVARLIRQTGLTSKALEGFHWHGLSGVRHEIDVFIVTKKETVGLVECTRIHVGLDEVLKLKAKIDDLQADFGLLFSVSDIEPDARRFGSRYRFHTFGELLEHRSAILSDVKKTLEVVS